MNRPVFPHPLHKGDTVAIVSPASIIDPDYVAGAIAAIEARGYRATTGAHTLGTDGSYSGTPQQRLDDMLAALTDPGVRAILCSRGGYGCVHLLDRLRDAVDPADAKWLIGFSDVSALHALWHQRGIVSAHASMAKHLTLFPDTDPANTALWSILEGHTPAVSWKCTLPGRCGQVTATILGGNLAVIADLISTPYDTLRPDTILFIEDIAEPIYKVERILWQLRLSGVLPNLAGLIVGQFTDYRPDRNYTTMEAMIAEMTAPYGYPVAFGAPIGHVDSNTPIIHGATATLTVAHDHATIHF